MTLLPLSSGQGQVSLFAMFQFWPVAAVDPHTSALTPQARLQWRFPSAGMQLTRPCPRTWSLLFGSLFAGLAQWRLDWACNRNCMPCHLWQVSGWIVTDTKWDATHTPCFETSPLPPGSSFNSRLDGADRHAQMTRPHTNVPQRG